MKFFRNHLAALAATLVLGSGCASEKTTEDVATTPAPAATERMAYQGTMNGAPMTLVVEPATNEFVILETVPASSGTPTQRRIVGRWTTVSGTGADANATIYELTPTSGGTPMRFVVVNDNELRLVADPSQPSASVVTFTRTSVPDPALLAVRLTPADAGTTVRLSPGEEVVLTLPVTAANQQWTWDESSTVPLTRVDLPPGESSATGQAIAFKATQTGNGTLKLTAPPGSTTTPKEFVVTIVVE